jgi:predicted transcriptional regulator
MAYQMIEPRQLKRIRSLLGVTQAKLANEAGVSQSLIAKIEAGKVDPTFTSMRAITDALERRRGASVRRAADLMSGPVVAVQAGATVSDCIAILSQRGISQMPVFEGGKHVGSVTEARIMELLSGGMGGRVLAQRVREVMGPALPTVSRETPVEALMSLFNHVPAVLVTSGESVEGIIAKIDLLAAEALGSKGKAPRKG